MTPPEETTVRDEVRAWLEANWDPERGLVAWRNLLIDAGWAAPTWPEAWYGKGFSDPLARVVDEEIERIGAVTAARTGIRTLAAATLLAHGTDLQRQRFLRRILTGEDTWCQLFSEPGSGSDMAGATTRAELSGNQWVINGQKVWTTSAHVAQYGLLLARTDWDVPKHQGLSFFIIDMQQPGVEVQPLRQMNGHASFNQVFMTDAAIEPELMVGEPGAGWAIATTTLMHERRGADSLRRYAEAKDRPGRIYEEERAEIDTQLEPYKWYPQRGGRADLVLSQAKARGRLEEPALRQEIARLLILDKTAQWTARRARAAQDLGRPQGPEGSLGKLAASNVAKAAAHVHTLIAGADAMLAGDDGPLDGLIGEVLTSVPAISIAGGTDEIQRNIIAERVLKMPKEMRVDTNRPFRDVPRNTVS